MREWVFRSALATCGTAAFLILVRCGGGTEAMRHDPEPYRELIVQIEDLIQKADPERKNGEELLRLSGNLAGAMGQNIDNYRWREAIQNRLLTFGTHFSEAEHQGLPFDPVEARAAWEAVRADLFQEADWFQ